MARRLSPEARVQLEARREQRPGRRGMLCDLRGRWRDCDSETRPRRACEGQERGEASWSASDSPCAGETNP
jgi:hypothetical protein